MALQHRATCTCGWASEWLSHRFSANAEAEMHNDECDVAEASAESVHDYEVFDDVENPRPSGGAA